MSRMTNSDAAAQQLLATQGLQMIEPLDVLGLLRRLWFGRWTLLLSTAVAVALAAGYVFGIAQPQYAATTTLQINETAAPVMNIDQALTGRATDPAQINTQVAILRSRHLVAQVISDLDLLADPEFNPHLTPARLLSFDGLREQARTLLTGQPHQATDAETVLDDTIENLTRAIAAGSQRDTYIFYVTATTSDPDKSALITNTLAQTYLTDQVAGKHAETETVVSWLSDKVYELQITLQSKETAINDMIAQAQVRDSDLLDALSRQAEDTTERLEQAQADLTRAQAALDRVSQAIAVRAGTAAASPEHIRLQAVVDRYSNQVAALTVFQTSLNRQLADQSAGLVQLQQLRREADATRVIYETFLARLQQTNIQRGLQNANSRILAPASAGSYVAPRKALILLAATLLGLMAGIGIVLLRQAMRNGFSDATGLARSTGLPVMAQIPRMPLRKRGQMLAYLDRKPSSMAAEAIRNLRTSLLLSTPGKTPQVLLSTSSVPGEGKTTHSIALAHNLAGLGKSVLLIEADIRQGAFSHYFREQTKAGIAEVLSGQITIADAVISDKTLGADVLSARSTAQNPADLFANPALGALLVQLRRSYDFIILDAPPVLPVPDARLLAQHADAVLYSVRWNRTSRDLVQAGQDTLAAVNAPITGLILAQIDIRKLQREGGSYFATYGEAYFQN